MFSSLARADLASSRVLAKRSAFWRESEIHEESFDVMFFCRDSALFCKACFQKSGCLTEECCIGLGVISALHRTRWDWTAAAELSSPELYFFAKGGRCCAARVFLV